VRAFVAVTIPEEASSEGETPKGASPEHLTLRFLGEVDEATVDQLTRRLGPVVAGCSSFEFVVDGVGVFPRADRPRVVWRGVTRGAGDLEALARLVREVVESVGLAPDRTPFVPHVTLFRVRSARDRERAVRLLRSAEETPAPVVVSVRSVDLVESRLEPRGAIHRIVARFPLDGATG
jgi:RNA 2',3'-cyclic 3'-phosphodiesterase